MADGHYSDSPPTLSASGGGLRVEHCIAARAGPQPSAADFRIRLVAQLTGGPEVWDRGGPTAGQPVLRWRLAAAEVFLEQRRDAEGVVEGWTTRPRLPAEALQPPPEGEGLFWESWSGALLALLPPPAGQPPAEGGGRQVTVSPWWSLDPRPQWALASRAQSTGGLLLLLPAGLWLFVEQASPDMLIVESGVLHPNGLFRSVVSTSYTGGQLDSVAMGDDRLVSAADKEEQPAQQGVGYSGEEATDEEVALENETLREFDLLQDDDGKSSSSSRKQKAAAAATTDTTTTQRRGGAA